LRYVIGASASTLSRLSAEDTVMGRPSRDLMTEVYPRVPIRKKLGERETLLSIDRARSVLGYDPKWSWRNAR